MSPVLVAGAGGGAQGSTGRHVTRLLLERGQAVRALVHREDGRADELRAIGAEVVAGDLRDIAAVLPAMHGVRRAFFTYPVIDGLLDAASAFAAAAREHGLEQVVEVSQLRPAPDARSPRTRQHWVAEQVFDWAAVGAVHLRATVFFENLRALLRAGTGDELAVPLGPEETVLPLVAAEDVARVAAGMLASPDADATGPHLLVGEVLTVAGVVGAFGDALGRRLRYVDLAPEQWRRGALERGAETHTVEHLSRLWEVLRTTGAGNVQVTDAIARVGGRPPQTLRGFARALVDGRDGA